LLPACQITVQNRKLVRGAAAIWSKNSDDVESVLVDAWLAAGRTEEAIGAARRIEDPQQRVSKLLKLAGDLLDEAGAPIF
jgi:hypothetical protein